ncbi:MAG: hypothetical protein F4139_05100 [Gemmatimonadetes bacterium]|nr:hypothetical protein [Gemmatimonadota bacterium]MYH52312.1 hypothetical protein [Gemmatimonadota bacterium]MYK65467.1 hypothetical protein [Gemmatimonadota bacterium]
MNRRRPSLAVIGGTTICLACTGAPDETPQSEAGEWELVEDLRLDANAEDFSAIRWVFVGPQREIVVHEPQDVRLRLYDPTGTLVATIGRMGEGPGEFQHLGPVLWAADTLIVVDMRLSRTTYWLLDGTLVRTEPVPFREPNWDAEGGSSFFHSFGPSAVDDRGAMLGMAYRVSVSTNGTWEESSRHVVLRVGRDGEPGVLAEPPQYDDERWSVTVSGVTNWVPFAFQPWPEFAPDGSRFLFATTDQSTLDGTISLTMIRASGDTVFTRSHAYPGEPIPTSALDSAVSRIVSESGRDRRVRALARERAPLVYPPAAVTLGLDGTIWVELRRTDRGTPVHVLSETGDPIGSLLLPPRTRIQQASMTHLWVTEYDPLDLASVVRYRVIRHTGTGPGGGMEE